MKKKITVLPGDGIGEEVMSSAIDILKTIEDCFSHEFEITRGAIGGIAIDLHGTPLPAETLQLCQTSDAVLLGAVGGPKWTNVPIHLSPEQGLLQIRKELGLFSNLRPISTFKSLLDSSPLKTHLVENVDFVIIRELTGGLYFGKPSERRGKNKEVAVDTLQYERNEIERIVHKAFQLALSRKQKVTSVDKANILESSRMWREVVDEISLSYPSVVVEHLLIDVAAMKLLYQPKQFDVIVTENLFGDILSDEASVLTGSLGMLPSASLREDDFGLYEPVHGSAPDIAGQDKANPLAMILSVAMMLRHSFKLPTEAIMIEMAVEKVLNDGYRTADLKSTENDSIIGTSRMSQLIVENLVITHALWSILQTYR
ncbi:3-isopropylmalate dehydrogenase [Bacillus thuringiensis]|uniref:3-isopropylmalate dehydrogenase n=1 Tax=Bacillus thuringiensis TaxID=1428 RepID=UPI000BF68C2B|nr:3-isopropylmalate dehydrogenase [Bacillus thuringiensis]PFB52528.1 3-isopropylmalate dehydrogenase [Bacillus thuringiensis]